MDFSNPNEGRYLIRRLSEFNPWWQEGSDSTLTEQYYSVRSEFYELHEKLIKEDRSIYQLSGPDGIGKTALLKQLISALIDSDFIEKFYRTPGFRSEARKAIVDPRSVLYLPLADDPLVQIRGSEQLQAAVDYFETHHLPSHRGDDESHYIILDDVDVFAARRSLEISEDLLGAVKDIGENAHRNLILTAATDEQLPDDLIDHTPNRETITENHRKQLLPMNLEDFLRFRFREIETTAKSHRFNPERAREALRESILNGDPTIAAEQLSTEVQNAAVPVPEIRREISYYLTTGGYLGQRLVSPVGRTNDPLDAILRGQVSNEFDNAQSDIRTEIRQMLRTRAPELGVNGEPAHLEQLCALVAEEHPISSVKYASLTDLFSIDRRTLRDNYFSILSQLHLLSHSPQYDNRRPRLVRLYLRDPGIANAFARRDLNDVLKGDRDIGTALSKSIVFDHTVRLSNHLNDPRDPKRGIVKFWVGDDGEVDFVLKVNGRPIPIYWTGGRDPTGVVNPEGSGRANALTSFLTSNAMESERDPLQPQQATTTTNRGVDERREYVSGENYAGEPDGDYVYDGDPVFGVIITNNKGGTSDSVTLHAADSGRPPILEVPLWVFLRLG